MQIVIVVGLFVAAVTFFLIAYNRTSKGSEKITGRGGDFES
jgi:hypothetical protein